MRQYLCEIYELEGGTSLIVKPRASSFERHQLHAPTPSGSGDIQVGSFSGIEGKNGLEVSHSIFVKGGGCNPVQPGAGIIIQVYTCARQNACARVMNVWFSSPSPVPN